MDTGGPHHARRRFYDDSSVINPWIHKRRVTPGSLQGSRVGFLDCNRCSVNKVEYKVECVRHPAIITVWARVLCPLLLSPVRGDTCQRHTYLGSILQEEQVDFAFFGISSLRLES